MRILLAHNSLYYPSHGGGDVSNRLLMEALATHGHETRVVTRSEHFGPDAHHRHLATLAQRGIHATGDPVRIFLHRVDVHTLTLDPNLRAYFTKQIAEFDPDVILTSTDDPAQLLLEPALEAPRARVVFLARATIALPFGPDSSSHNPAKTARLREADAAVGVSEYVARYMREWGAMDAVHVPISLMERGEPALLGNFQNPYVTMVNPCAVKGISIFLALADRMPHLQFAAVPTWGANDEDLAALRARPNITLLEPSDNIDDILRLTRVLLVPSVWAEARSRIVVEAMARGVPVIASNAGGIPEAKLGVDYLLPVNLLTGYKPSLDSRLVPVADVPPQNVEPWQTALERLTTDRAHYEALAAESRRAALNYIAELSVGPFEELLQRTVAAPRKPRLSPERRKLLALRLRQKPSWFPHCANRALFCFPYAGAGTLWCRGWNACPALLPGREARLAEAPVESVQVLVAELEKAIVPLLHASFAFFGHSMGAAIAFELARSLRRNGRPLPAALFVSACRPPRWRAALPSEAPPSDKEILADLDRLGTSTSNPEWMRSAFPALRADIRLFRAWRPQQEPPLEMPIYAYCGESDPNLQISDMEGWREETTGPFHTRTFPGGHFYFEAPFLETLQRDQEGVTGLSSSGVSS